MGPLSIMLSLIWVWLLLNMASRIIQWDFTFLFKILTTQLQHRDEPCQQWNGPHQHGGEPCQQWNQPHQHQHRIQLQRMISFFAVITALNPLFAAKIFEYVPPYISEINWSILCFTFFLYICLMNVVLVGEGSQYYLLCGWSHVCFSLITAIIITTRLLCRFLNVLGWKRRIGLFLCYFIII